jgi:hypothetical protein
LPLAKKTKKNISLFMGMAGTKIVMSHLPRRHSVLLLVFPEDAVIPVYQKTSIEKHLAW